MIADDEIDAEGSGFGHPINGFYAAIEGNNEREAIVGGVVYPRFRDAITLFVAVRNIVFELVFLRRIVLWKETLGQIP